MVLDVLWLKCSYVSTVSDCSNVGTSTFTTFPVSVKMRDG